LNGTGDEVGRSAETKIVGGVETMPNEYPWIIRIQSKAQKGLLCGGVIISKNTILTAAHCLFDSNLKNFEVVAGEHKTNVNEGTEQVRNIKEAIIHKSYTE